MAQMTIVPLSTFTLITVAICVAAATSLAFLRFIRRDLHVPDIPGPVANASWFYGNLPELLLSKPYGKFEFKWQEQYGSVYRFKGCFSEDLLLISDPAALRYIFNNATLFDLSRNREFMVTAVAGEGSLVALRGSGEAHRRIKNAFSSAFTSAHLLPYVSVIRDIARKAADKLMQQYTEKSEQNVTMDIFQLLHHLTSDIMGEVGFGYNFNAVETDGGDDVAQSHQHVLMLAGKRSKNAILGEGVIPYLPRMLLKPMLEIPLPSFRTLRNFRKTSKSWAAALLRDRLQPENTPSAAGLMGFVAAPNKNQKREQLSFDEISDQAGAILVAAQDSTANTLAWALYELAKRPAWQDQIRKEITEAQQSNVSLDKLEYLNAHIKETLRFHTVGPLTEREAYDEAVLPLSRPITTTSGRVITELPVRKGQVIYIGMASFNRDPHIWGPDANTFEPLRWVDDRYHSADLPGIGPYSNLASFGGGTRACLGWRLAILQLQVILAELVSKFNFTFTAEQGKDVVSCVAVTLLPVSVRDGKPSLSMFVRPLQASD